MTSSKRPDRAAATSAWNQGMAPPVARNLIHKILATGSYELSNHSDEQAEKRNMNNMDVINVLRSGAVEGPTDFVHGHWRYRVATAKMTVVVAITSATSLVVVTAWRNS